MKSAYTIVKDDFEQIKAIQSKWRYQEMKKEQKEDFKRLHLTFTEEQNQDFQLPDVFITTKQYHAKPAKSPRIKKKQSFSFDLGLQSISMSKNQRNLELSTMESNYKKFKQIQIIKIENIVVLLNNLQEKKSQINVQQLQEIITFIKLMVLNFQKVFMLFIKKEEKSQMTYFETKLVRILYIEQNNMKNKTKNNVSFKQLFIILELQKQKKNKQKEYRSRSFLDNAYFSILSVNRESQQRIKKMIQYSLPKESRFQQF
ncbi:unnamed protein product [Paramecium sonneborni]|uniref:Uncharacterized protein n=1 Tax=Paramecium sonneborni TaxID=65129 RepID=A0A8S1NAH2_9CILI|nr:unnamed protein product [Paramecium sonneborni]